jgi:hypothetical protein
VVVDRAIARWVRAPRAAAWARHPTTLAAIAAVFVLLLTYGPGLRAGRVIVPADMLEAFPPWTATATTPNAPANGLLGDQIQQMYPWRVFAHEEFAAGRFPLWNPYAGGGVPLFANGQSALLFPLNLAVLWLDPAVAATIVQLAKPPLAAMGAALFLRALGVGTAASAFGGLAWAFSGPMVVWLGWPHTNALLMIGYVFWTATRWLQQRTPGWWVASALALGVQLLGGHPETTAHTVVAAGIFVGVWSATHAGQRLLATASPPQEGEGTDRPASRLRERRRSNTAWRPILVGLVWGPAGWLAAVGVGAALAGAQVVPTLAAIADSVTAAERGARSLAWILLERETLLTWLVPNYFGTPLVKSFGPIEFLNYNETVGYAGAGTIALALVSAVAWRRPGWLPVFVFTLVAAGLAYGIPLITELRRLPGLGHAANTRFVFILAFGIACLGALGLDACLRSPRPWGRWLAVALAAVGGLVALAFALMPERVLSSPAEAAPIPPLEAALWRQEVLGRSAALAALWVGALGALALWPTRAAAACLCVGALIVDLAVFSAGYNPTLSPEILTRVPDSVRFIQGQGQRERGPDHAPEMRVAGIGEALLPNAGMIHKLVDLRVYEPVAHRRLLDFFERVDPALKDDIRSRFYLFIWHPDVDLLGLASVRWLVVPHGDPRVITEERLVGAGLLRQFADAAVTVWENPSARGRAYLADAIVEVADEREALARLSEVARATNRAAVVERSPGVGALRVARNPGDVRIASWPGGARLAVSAPDGGLLVVNDTFYPGWVATVDGLPTSILWTNYLFMGVPLEPGDHVVLLSYTPASVPLGAGISLVAALSLAIVGVLGRNRVKNRAA